MYIERVPNRNSPPAVLLRESYWKDGRAHKRTLANLSKWPPEIIEGLRVLLKGGRAVSDPCEAFDIIRSLPHGHVAAVLGTLRKLKLDRIIDSSASAQRERAVALIVARILAPGSKPATARGLSSKTAGSSLAEMLDIENVDENELYDAVDWLLQRRGTIERRLAERHLRDGSLILYDLTSAYLEGKCCSPAQFGYSRDRRKGKMQIVFGLLCNDEGCPVAVEVFEGNTADPGTLSVQIDKIRNRFGLSRIVLVGDRGMLTEARIRNEVEPAGLDWISALRTTAISDLVVSGAVQLPLTSRTDPAEIRSDDYPGERLVVCHNKHLAFERKNKREILLKSTEKLLDSIVDATRRDKRKLKGKEKIALRVGKAIGRYKTAKHFEFEITDNTFEYRRKSDSTAAESALDGIYIVRTGMPADELDAEQAVRAYKNLSAVERAFRSFKTVDLKVRPVYHYKADRVRAHVLLCMPAYYVEWHMRRSLKPLLFDDEKPEEAQEARSSVVDKAKVSSSAEEKSRSKRTVTGEPVHSFRTLLEDLATICRNRMVAPLDNAEPFEVMTKPTELQQKVFELLGVKLKPVQ